MANCPTCIGPCCHRWEPCQIFCATDCCGCCPLPTIYGPNQTIEAGTIVAQRASDLLFFPFDPTATDGLQEPLGIQEWTITIDANGRVQQYFNPFVPTSECGPLYSNRFICGIFYTQQLKGDVAAAWATGRLVRVEGTISSGLSKFV